MSDPEELPAVADDIDESEDFAQCMRLLVKQSREAVETYFLAGGDSFTQLANEHTLLVRMRGLHTTLKRLDSLVAERGGSSVEDLIGGVN